MIFTGFSKTIDRIAPLAVVVASAMAFSTWLPPLGARAQTPAPQQAETLFNTTCVACHGAGGGGGDRAPAIADSMRLRAMPDAQISGIIRNGTPGGMPPFALSETELTQITALIRSKNQIAASTADPQQIAAGKLFFFGKGECATCHAAAGVGGSRGPDLTTIGGRSSAAEIDQALTDPTAWMGFSQGGACAGWAACAYSQWSVANVRLRDGSALRGFVRNQSEHDVQLHTFDGKIHLLTDAQYVSIERENVSYMPPIKATAEEKRNVIAYLQSLKDLPLGPLTTAPAPTQAEIAAVIRPKSGDWPSYDGTPSGNRYSALDQINTANASKLQARWTFAPGGTGLENTPTVVDGVMYVTGAQQICALDARSGRSIWCTARNAGQPVTAGGVVDPPQAPRAARAVAAGPAPGNRAFGGIANGSGPNRGAAVLGDRVYFVSDDAYMVCLNRLTGGVIWTVPITDPAYRGRYYNTAAPLVIGDLIVTGVAGGDTPLRGFVAAFKAATGELAWRLWTIPRPGEPLAKTWKGSALPTGGGGTWTTGSYDVETNTLYWAVGNPYPDYDGTERGGANLYSNSVLAIDPANGRVKWHFQFTPHDLHDWDASAPLVLADAVFRGQKRKLLLQANRNGYFYVLDRTSGKFLLGKAFVKNLTWSSGIDAKGVPILLPNNFLTDEGVITCPNVRGAANWYSTSFSPVTQLFYVSAAETCGFYRKGVGPRQFTSPLAGRQPERRFVRALNISTGEIVWEKELVGPPDANYGGVLTTAGGLAFHGETGGGFAAVDAKTGKTLWHFSNNDNWRATAMTYLVDGKQYVAIAGGNNITAFALGE